MIKTYTQWSLSPFPKRQILDSSKLKEFAGENFKFDENEGKSFKRIENTVGKEKLLVTSNFSFSHSAFKRLVLQTRKNQGLFGKELNWLVEKVVIIKRFLKTSTPHHMAKYYTFPHQPCVQATYLDWIIRKNLV